MYSYIIHISRSFGSLTLARDKPGCLLAFVGPMQWHAPIESNLHLNLTKELRATIGGYCILSYYILYTIYYILYKLNGGTQTQQQYHKVYVDGKGTQWWKTTQTQRFAFHKEKPYVCFSWAKCDSRVCIWFHVQPGLEMNYGKGMTTTVYIQVIYRVG